MLISNMRETSELYNTLAAVGALTTEKRSIDASRIVTSTDRIDTARLSYSDIQGIGYRYPHFKIDIREGRAFEVWIDDEYINPEEITWIEGTFYLYGILPRDYNVDSQQATIVHCPGLLTRYSRIASEDGYYVHKEQINISKYPYKSIQNARNCAYYIADGKICVPDSSRPDNDTIEFYCAYTRSIDLFICGDLAGVYNVKANQGVYIDNLYSHQSYHRFAVNNDYAYPVETKFYPCVKVDKDCVLRVYNDVYSYVPCPEVTRLMLYPEFIEITDPYNCDNTYLNALPDLDVQILGSDDDETILKKFEQLSPYCYRVWEKFPKFDNEQSDFLMCDNRKFGHPTFYRADIHRLGEQQLSGKIISTVPFEPHRDILFYRGYMFDDYRIINTKTLNDGTVIEDENGFPTYVIDGTYEVDEFTLIKFNAAEDTVISNIGDFIDVDNVVELHTRLNRFYRNLLILRGKVLDMEEVERVRVSTVEPIAKDQFLWFELLVNAVPEMFGKNPIQSIRSFGLDPDNVPEDLKEGAYSLSLDEDGGPESYTELLFTYFKLGKAQKNYLAFQSDEQDKSDTQEFHSLRQGSYPDKPKLNETILADEDGIDKPSIVKFTSGLAMPTDPQFGDIHSEREDHDGNDGIDELLDGVGIADVEEFGLSDITYMNTETGKVIDGATISAMSIADKIALVESYIQNGDESERERVKTIWDSYLETFDEESLDIAVYKILLTDYVYNQSNILREADAYSSNPKPHKYVMSDTMPTDEDIGTYWLDVAANANAPTIDACLKWNLTYIMSAREPDTDVLGALWIDIPALTLQDYVEDIISHGITEGYYNFPDGFFDGTSASVHFDYGANGAEGEHELFVRVQDQSLHVVHVGEANEVPVDGDLWYEFLDDIDNKVCYSDTENMVIKINERLVLLQFEHDNITAFAFDDIVLNFRGQLGIRYISILADLINSGTINMKDVNIFYNRLVTGPDYFELKLNRLFTGRSHVISTPKIDTANYAVTYSTNIGRLRIDYRDEDVTNREREAAWRMVIDYSYRDIAFLEDRMMLFVNGQYIPYTRYEEIAPGKIQIKEFPETIECIDIFYSKKDYNLSRAKRIAINHWDAYDYSESIQRPERDYGKMQPIHVCDHTNKGYYDVLINEYIFNGKLLRILRYLEEHPDEADFWIRDFIRKFHAISDMDVVGRPEDTSRIIIPAFSTGEQPAYTIHE